MPCGNLCGISFLSSFFSVRSVKLLLFCEMNLCASWKKFQNQELASACWSLGIVLCKLYVGVQWIWEFRCWVVQMLLHGNNETYTLQKKLSIFFTCNMNTCILYFVTVYLCFWFCSSLDWCVFFSVDAVFPTILINWHGFGWLDIKHGCGQLDIKNLMICLPKRTCITWTLDMGIQATEACPAHHGTSPCQYLSINPF